VSAMAPGAPGDGRPPQGRAAKTQRERNDERRRQKLQDIEEKVRAGSLVIRQMTAEERADMPARPRKQRPA
jgi:hypothetical protein